MGFGFPRGSGWGAGRGCHREGLLDHLADALEDLVDRGVAVHVGGGGDEVVGPVGDGLGDACLLVGGAHGFGGFGGVGVVSEGQGDAS